MRQIFPLLLAAALLLSACASSAEPGEGEDGVLIYYLTGEARGGDCLRGSYEDLGLPADADTQAIARAAAERLLSGPVDGMLQSPLPADVELLDLEVRDHWAYVDFSEAFNNLTGVELTLADYCLTLTLTGVEGISAVSITAQGGPVLRQPKQVFYERDVLLSNMDDVLHTEEVTLYFLAENGTLAGESRVLEVYEGQTLADNLVAALLEGPEDRELERVIPEDFQVGFVRVEDGVCYISIPAASLALLPESEGQQRLILHSLADSLYSLAPVEELHLLSEGEEPTFFGQVPVEEVAVRPE